MRRITLEELEADCEAAVALAEAGEEFIVTRGGEDILRLIRAAPVEAEPA